MKSILHIIDKELFPNLEIHFNYEKFSWRVCDRIEKNVLAKLRIEIYNKIHNPCRRAINEISK